jgi:hypothetical protein
MQFIGDECANHRDDGSCLGMPVLLTKDSKMFPAEKCRVAEKKRCDYFEKCVLPLATRQGIFAVLKAYGKIADAPGLVKGVQFCDCGAAIGQNDKLCERCRAKNRRETMRRAMARYRKSAV